MRGRGRAGRGGGGVEDVALEAQTRSAMRR